MTLVFSILKFYASFLIEISFFLLIFHLFYQKNSDAIQIITNFNMPKRKKAYTSKTHNKDWNESPLVFSLKKWIWS
jgi:hypothetical protein